MNSFSRQTALITGAASGIGRELALQLAAEGAAIAALDVNAAGLISLGEELAGKPFAFVVADVTDAGAVQAAVAEAQERLGRVDLLFASAGIGCETSALELRAEDVEAVVRVNLIGVANSIAAVLPGMLQRGRGHLVAISSLASYRGMPFMAGYCAAKAGVNAMMDSLRVELRDKGVACTTVCPGWVRTPMTQHLDIPMPGLLEAEEAARRILEGVRRRRPFIAFPAASARRVALLRGLPLAMSDWLVARVYGKLRKK
jgi:NAD(P)-dependent dehydrogenase (short-subunit alcohol dehydrogenase family)